MNTYNEGSTSALVADLKAALTAAEEAEHDLSYFSKSKTERGRKESGSYYTPADVCAFFWREYFALKGISTKNEFSVFAKDVRLIEPSAGAGALVFALLLKLAKEGVPKKQISEMEIILVDINEGAIAFLTRQFNWLSQRFGVKFKKLRLICADFKRLKIGSSRKKTVVFGNPPYVANEKGARWKNSFADFTQISLKLSEGDGDIHLIVPLSIAFSRDYAELRANIRAVSGSIVLSNFDNIPDTIFKAGKPQSLNSNKANSQRCTILSLLRGPKKQVLSTPLLRWPKRKRASLLARSPQYVDVSSYRFDDQFPRPQSAALMRYLERADGGLNFGALIDNSGKNVLYVASVARNYLGIREEGAGNAHRLVFKNNDDFCSGLRILSSDLFMAYWLTIGDGFHVTKGNIYDFPISKNLLIQVTRQNRMTKKVWDARYQFIKTKLNAGQPTHSYDFSEAMPSLLDSGKLP